MFDKKLIFIFLLVLLIGTISAVSASECTNDSITDVSDDNLAIADFDSDLTVSTSDNGLDVSSSNDNLNNKNSLNETDFDSDYSDSGCSGSGCIDSICIDSVYSDSVCSGSGCIDSVYSDSVCISSIGSDSVCIDSVCSDSGCSGCIDPVSSDLNEIDNHKYSFEKIIKASNKGTFTELQDKINKANAGSTIYLDKNYYYGTDYKGSYGLIINKTLTIDGNGHVIDGSSKSMLALVNASNVVFRNIKFRNGKGGDNGAINAICSGNIEFNNCSFIKNSGSKGSLYMSSSNHSTFFNCSFEENHGKNGGAVFLSACDYASFFKCDFSLNSADYSGGALYLYKSNHCTFSDSHLGGNEASDGGALFLAYCDYASFKKCDLEGSDASNTGGAIYLSHSLSPSFSNVDFYFNRAVDGGGAFLTNCDSPSFSNCLFYDDEASYAGSGLYLYSCYNSSVGNCNFSENGASDFEFSDYGSGVDGGAIFISDSINTRLYENYFAENEATSFGAAVSVNNADVYLDSCEFYENTAYNSGGAIYTSDADVYLDSCTFLMNFAINGSCLYSYKSNVHSHNSSFLQLYEIIDEYVYIHSQLSGGKYQSIDGNLGGAIYSLQSVLELTSSNFNSNIAFISGGDIYSQYSMVFIDDCSFTNSNSSGFGGSLSFSNDYVQILDCLFENCSSDYNGGGGIYAINSVLNCSSLEFRNCSSYFGGSICTLNTELSIDDNRFYNSSAEYYGGSIYTIYGSIAIDNSLFSDSYGQYGGSIYIRSPHTINNITNNLFLNSIGKRGPRIYLDGYYGEIPERGNVFEDEYAEDEELFSNFGNIYAFESGYGLVPLINSHPSNVSKLPSRYDPRDDEDGDIGIKDQGIGGNCWAFSGIATLEACIDKITGQDYDFSEDNAKNLMAVSSIYGLNIDTNAGGYDSMFMAYLASWLGPIYEDYDNYNPLSSLSIDLSSIFHIQDIAFIPARSNSSDNNKFKRAIMDYGAVTVTFDWIVNKTSSGFHSVSLIGWDDDYDDIDSLGNYAKGAWIFKNSWGYDWEDGGFGYLSYKQKLSEEIAPYMHAYTFVFNESNMVYTDIYQYDFSGLSDFLIANSSKVYYKNKFTAEGNEFLYAFSTYFEKDTYFSYSVTINGREVNMTDDGLPISSSVIHSQAGYHTIPLGYNLTLNEGDEFEIIIKLISNAHVPVCQADELYKSSLPSNTSFISSDGEEWFDLYDLSSYYNFAYGGSRLNTSQVACIKAFTSIWRMNSSSIENSRNHTIISSDGDVSAAYEICPIKLASFTKASVGEDVAIVMAVPNWQSYQDEYENFIEVHINDKVYYAKVSEGIACLNLCFDKRGHYNFTAQLKSNIFSSDIVGFDFDIVKDAGLSGARLIANKSNLGTFSQLQDKINSAKEKSVIVLDRDYAFDSSSAGDSKKLHDNFIEINKSVTIDGKGHVLDGNSISGIFKVSSNSNVTLRNINFVGANKGAIVSFGDLLVSNCNFAQDSVSGGSGSGSVSGSSGGAIYSDGTCYIVNCGFRSNSAESGGAIYSDGTCYIVNSEFDLNSAEYGAALCSLGSCFIVNSEFDSNWADFGGAIFLDKDSNSSGGAIYLGADSVILSSGFVENGGSYGGAIFSNQYCFINGSGFDSNLGEYGGAIYFLDDVDICYSTFDYNSADYGGAVYLLNGTAYIDETEFNENTAEVSGGAICSREFSNLTIQFSKFAENMASKRGSAIFSVNILNITYSEVTSGDGDVELICFAYDYGSNGSAYGDLYFKENDFYSGRGPEIFYYREKVPHALPVTLDFEDMEVIKGESIKPCRLVDEEDFITEIRMKEIELTLINKNNKSDVKRIKLQYDTKSYGYVLNTSSLNYGAYIISGTISKNLAVNCTSDNATIKIVKKSVLSTSALTKVYGTNKKLSATLKDSDGKAIANVNVTVKLNGKTYKLKTNSKGQISLKVNLKPKTYTAYVRFAGTDYYSSAGKYVKVVIKKASPKISASKKTFRVGKKTKSYTVALKNNLGKAIKNAKVTIKINGKTYTGKTNSKGIVVFKLKLTKVGKFTATIRFAGNKLYKAVSKKVAISIKR
ncbi:MAG: hypothetical protein IKV87_03260 [Methanobrevibacter sp.]|nr:hypothetical protein [Methanobrevibacter sp.]